MMTRPHFLKLALGAVLAPLAAWWPKKRGQVIQARDAKLFVNGVEVPMRPPVAFAAPPRYDGDRAVIVGEWDERMGFHASLIEPIDEHTWTHLFEGIEE